MKTTALILLSAAALVLAAGNAIRNEMPRKGVTAMMKISNTIWTLLACITILTPNAGAISYWSLADQSTYRCPGGLVAIGDSDRSVRETCGDPLEITSREDKGPIWVYHFRQERFMYYLEFVFGKLERILSAPCDRNKFECFDLD